MKPGDDILIVEGDTIKLLGKLFATTISPDLSRELWQGIAGDNAAVWSLIYFIANPLDIELPFKEFNRLFGYQENYLPHGFTSISSNRLEEFYSQYDDLYSILLRIKQGQQYEVRQTEELLQIKEDAVMELQAEDVEEILKGSELSDHVRMQIEGYAFGLKSRHKQSDYLEATSIRYRRPMILTNFE